MLGIDNIPKEWIDVIELKDLLENISIDLLTGYEESEEWFERVSWKLVKNMANYNNLQ